MARIEKENDCYATFSKRRVGLFKKASEVSTLCDADVGLFILSPTGKPYSFFHPSMEAVLTPFHSVAADDASRLLEAYSRTRVFQLNQMLCRVDEELEEEEEREKELEKRDNYKWWEEPVQNNLNKEQLQNLIALLKNMQSQLSTHRLKINI